uniref:Uncharacterized protein n=1 Tax=Solanum tuberosum TaxID=4113 RepID=M1AHX3_SOLTU
MDLVTSSGVNYILGLICFKLRGKLCLRPYVSSMRSHCIIYCVFMAFYQSALICNCWLHVGFMTALSPTLLELFKNVNGWASDSPNKLRGKLCLRSYVPSMRSHCIIYCIFVAF